MAFKDATPKQKHDLLLAAIRVQSALEPWASDESSKVGLIPTYASTIDTDLSNLEKALTAVTGSSNASSGAGSDSE